MDDTMDPMPTPAQSQRLEELRAELALVGFELEPHGYGLLAEADRMIRRYQAWVADQLSDMAEAGV